MQSNLTFHSTISIWDYLFQFKKLRKNIDFYMFESVYLICILGCQFIIKFNKFH